MVEARSQGDNKKKILIIYLFCEVQIVVVFRSFFMLYIFRTIGEAES